MNNNDANVCHNDNNISDISFCLNREHDNRIDNIVTLRAQKYNTIQRICIDKSLYSDDFIKSQNINSINTNIYRFKFTQQFTNELAIFSKVHQYDERKDFKEAWKLWLEDNNDIVNEEITRLKSIGFTGDIEDKMFKSARYYFRKKTDDKKEPVQRRQYISMNKKLLDSMDIHIQENPDLQPKISFSKFCQKYEDIIKEELEKMIENGITDPNLIRDKIKKTYKNRYFKYITK